MPGLGGLGQPPAFGPAFPAGGAGGAFPGGAAGGQMAAGAGMGQQQQQQAAGAGGAMQANPINGPFGIAPQVFSQDAINVRHTATTAPDQTAS